jgi:phosphoribosylaminoimidazole-succinocarboxamide synthase
VTRPSPILETSFAGLTRHNQGKVRDIYSFPEDPTVLLIVATDRISAFDYVLGSGIPDKGKVLNQLSAFWFGETRHIVANHMQSTSAADYPDSARPFADALSGRSMMVVKTEPFRLRLEGISTKRVGMRRQVAGGPAGIGRAARADFHAGDEGRHRA